VSLNVTLSHSSFSFASLRLCVSPFFSCLVIKTFTDYVLRVPSWRGPIAGSLALVAFLSIVASDLAAAGPRAGQVIAEFEIAPDGDFIRLPVVVDQHEYRFLFSTGMTTTIIDDELRSKLDLKKIAVEFRGKRSSQMRERFGGFYATLGEIPLEFPAGVETGDYAALEKKLDLECQGEIGMDVLSGYVIQIDFVEGFLRFLAALPPSPGEAIRMTPLDGEGGAPTIPGLIAGMPAQKFVVSSAFAGNSLSIRSELLSSLEEKDKVKMLDKEKAVTRSGSLVFQTGRLDAFQVGKFRHEGLLVNSGEQNGIGVSYLSRYLVTFDFPHSKLYLKKGAHFEDPDARLNLWDVGVERDDNQLAIRDVHAHSQAARMGLREGDIVETLNGIDVRRFSNWQVRRLFGREGRPLIAVVRRGTGKLTLRNDSSAAADDAETK
jgi:hypothetical protein